MIFSTIVLEMFVAIIISAYYPLRKQFENSIQAFRVYQKNMQKEDKKSLINLTFLSNSKSNKPKNQEISIHSGTE